jgi:hypothetical protein
MDTFVPVASKSIKANGFFSCNIPMGYIKE